MNSDAATEAELDVVSLLTRTRTCSHEFCTLESHRSRAETGWVAIVPVLRRVRGHRARESMFDGGAYRLYRGCGPARSCGPFHFRTHGDDALCSQGAQAPLLLQ